MATTIQDNPILLKGDTFWLNWTTWYRLVTQSTDPLACVPQRVVARVDRIYTSGDRLIYVCRTESGMEPYKSFQGAEFVLESSALQDVNPSNPTQPLPPQPPTSYPPP